MALKEEKLVSDLKSMYSEMSKDTNTNIEEVQQKMAEKMASIIDGYIRSQTITVNGVITMGSPSSQTQTAPVVATIS